MIAALGLRGGEPSCMSSTRHIPPIDQQPDAVDEARPRRGEEQHRLVYRVQRVPVPARIRVVYEALVAGLRDVES